MRIVLINPPYPFEENPSPPFGLISLGAYLIENGHEVIIEDYIVNRFSDERVKRVISEFRPDVIGATAVTMDVKNSIAILKKYREASPQSVIMMGGPHVTFDSDAVLRENAFIDYIVRGEGELTTVELLECVASSGNPENVAGISYIKNGVPINNPDRPFIENIDILPIPARHLIQLSKYRAANLPVSMITSRGCPHTCIFCVGSRMVGRKVRYFSIGRVVDEFELLSKMSFNQINIVDDLFTSHKKRCMDICDEIKRRGIRHPWTAFARVDTVSPELLAAMKSAGCTTLCFGIESGNQEILDRVKKKTNLEMCQKAVRLCNEAGIEFMASYILGLPGETPDTVRQTLEFSKNLCQSYGFHILAPFPGTEVREKSDEYGLTILTSDWDRYDANQSVCETSSMPGTEVDSIVGEFNNAITCYIKETERKFRNNEALTESETTMIRNFHSAIFSIELLQNDLIEKFAAVVGCDPVKVRNQLVDYIHANTKFDRNLVSREIDRLIDLDCLAIKFDSKVSTVSWA